MREVVRWWLPLRQGYMHVCKKEIAVNSPEQINNNWADVATWDELAQHPANELMEVEAVNLEQVVGGGDGTALGTGRL